MTKSTRVYYLVWSAVLFLTEFAIALWAKGFLRNNVGDMLIIPLLYCMVRVLTPKLPRLLPVLACGAGFVAEGLQYIRLVDLLGLDHHSPLAVAIGTHASWEDLVCYIIGMLLIYLGMYVRSCFQKGVCTS